MLWESQPDHRFGRQVDSLGPRREEHHLVGHTTCQAVDLQAVVVRASLRRRGYKPSCGGLWRAEGWMTWVYSEATVANLPHQSRRFFCAGWPPGPYRQDGTGMQESPKLFTEMEEVP
jgi:hypothetical protein